jgi:hypothetical protein
VPRQHHETTFAAPLAAVFAALIGALARHRWAEGIAADGLPTPRVGCRYANERGSVLRRGRVLECLRPVSLTLDETLIDPPCRVRLRVRWRLEPIDAGCLLRLDVSYELNGAASFRAAHWRRQLGAHCRRMLGFVRARLASDQGSVNGTIGQSNGSSSITATKTTAVSGKPSFR